MYSVVSVDISGQLEGHDLVLKHWVLLKPTLSILVSLAREGAVSENGLFSYSAPSGVFSLVADHSSPPQCLLVSIQ